MNRFASGCLPILALLFPSLVWADPPQEARDHYNQGMSALKNRDFDQAITEFTEVIRLDPNNFIPYLQRGMAYGTKRELDRAIADFDKVIQLTPAEPIGYADRGYAYLVKQDYDRAITDFSEAIRLGMKDANVYYNRGTVHAQRKDHERALSDFDQAIRLAPQHPVAYYNRGNAYLIARKDYERAIADFKEAIRVNANFTYPYFALAHILASCPLANLRDGKQAVEYAKKGCELSRWQVPGGWMALAVAYAEIGDFKEAIKWQKKALESAEQFPKEQQEEMRFQLKLFEQGKPYRQK